MFTIGIVIVGCIVFKDDLLKLLNSEKRFDRIILEEEPDGIYSSPYTNKLAVVTDGRLDIFNEYGEVETVDTGIRVTFVFLLEDSMWVIDDKYNLYEMEYNTTSELSSEDIVLSEVKSFSCTPNEYNSLFSYGVVCESGDVYVWGCNKDYQFGIEGTDTIVTPYKIDYIHDIEQIDFGNGTTLLLSKDGSVYEAGVSKQISEGNGEFSYQYKKKFTKIDNLQSVKRIYNGSDKMVVLDNDDIEYWGYGCYEEGYQNETREQTFRNEGINILSFGSDYQMGMNQSGDVYYWGHDIINTPKDKSEPWVYEPTLVIENADMIYAGKNVGYVKKKLEILILKE